MADGTIGNATITKIGTATADALAQQPLQVGGTETGTSAFGDPINTSLSPEIGEVFTYGVNSRVVISQNNGAGATTDVVNSMIQVSTGAAASRAATARTRTVAEYRPGLGMRTRFTAVFTAGAAGSTQEIGVGDPGQGFFFGYNGADYGIITRKGGAVEVQTLTVSTASTTDESITITLNSQTASVAVTNTGNTTLTANEIAAHDYSNTGQGWDAVAVGSTVIFTSWNATPKAGTYSLSGATTAVGTFAQDIAGANPTTTFIAQADWNGSDIFDGNGVSGVTLDPTAGNVYQIVIPYLGFGAIKFFVKKPGGIYTLIHTINYENSETIPSLDNPRMPFFMRAINIANATDISIRSGSWAVFVEGEQTHSEIINGAEGSATLTGTDAETPVLTILNKIVFQGKLNRKILEERLCAISVEHTKPVTIKFYLNATLTGASFSDVDASDSVAAYDTSASAFTGGQFIFSVPLGKSADLAQRLELPHILPGETLTMTADPTSGNGAEANISITFNEN